jgi:hypothetical protein
MAVQVSILNKLRSLYALWTMTNEQSFLAYGYLSTSTIEIMEVEINKLFAELRPHLLALVDSFGIPVRGMMTDLNVDYRIIYWRQLPWITLDIIRTNKPQRTIFFKEERCCRMYRQTKGITMCRHLFTFFVAVHLLYISIL